MPWFKVDDSFFSHPKVLRLGRQRVPCVGLWLTAGLFSSVAGLDGFVPREAVTDWDPRGAYSARLVAVGLWSETRRGGESGYLFHDWHEYQLSSSEWEQRRKARAEAGRLGGLRSAQARRAKAGEREASA